MHSIDGASTSLNIAYKGGQVACSLSTSTPPILKSGA